MATRKTNTSDARAPGFSPTKQRTNADHIATFAMGTKKTSIALAGIAKVARENLTEVDRIVQQSVLSEDGSAQSSNRGASFSDADLKSLSAAFVRDVSVTISTGSVSGKTTSAVLRSVTDLVAGVTQLSVSPKTATAGPTNKARLDFDFVRVKKGKRGQSDVFSAELVFSIERRLLLDEKVKAVRIFRSERSSGIVDHVMSRFGVDSITADPGLTRSKNPALFGNVAQRELDDSGVQNALTKSTVKDEITGLRHGSSSGTGSIFVPDVIGGDDDVKRHMLESFIDPKIFGSIDVSVATDLNTLRNIQHLNPTAMVKSNPDLVFGADHVNRDVLGSMGRQQLIEHRRRMASRNSVISQQRNAQGFVELVAIPVSKLRSRTIGDRVEFRFSDDSVKFGRSYSYYTLSVDERRNDSIRSKIAVVDVVDLLQPPKPTSFRATQQGNTVSLAMFSDQRDIEKFEIYRKSASSSDIAVDAVSVGNRDGSMTKSVSSRALKNSFIYIGDAYTSGDLGASFIDNSVREGKTYVYRVYSVDILGRKSQRPATATVFVNERAVRHVDSRPPSVLAEIDEFTKKVKLSITHDDQNASAFIVKKKNHTIGDRSFTLPGQPEVNTFGDGSALGSRALEGTVLRDKSSLVNGFVISLDGRATLHDLDVAIDNVYQYQVIAIDRMGRESPPGFSKPVFVSRRPAVSRPESLSLRKDSRSVVVSWDDPNIHIDPEDRLGNREVLANNSVKSLYQVERREVGSPIWETFPLTENRFLLDRFTQDNESEPESRPSFLKRNSEYMYRVATFQSGGFISNFTEPVHVATFGTVATPRNMKITTCDIMREPFVVIVNWDSNDDGSVDHWIIERAVVNNFAAAKISSRFSLGFKTVSTVTRESSRGLSRELDEVIKNNRSALFTANRRFVDSDVTMGNTYYYRVTAVGVDERSMSKPVSRGIRLTDASFEKKLNSILTQAERNELAKKQVPLVLSVDLRR